MARREPGIEGGVRLGVVIPAYRAAATVGGVISGVKQVAPHAMIYAVDDGSLDGTGAAATRAGAQVLSLPMHTGKGAALATGIARAVGDGAAVVVTLDADGQHAPAEVPLVAGPVVAGQVDVALGARARTTEMPAGRRFNNWLSAALVSRIAGYPVADAQTGFRAFSRSVATAIRPLQRHYDYELAFLLGALAAGYRVGSVPVTTIYDGAESHFRPMTDTWRLARVFARYGTRILRGGPSAR